MGRAQTAVWLRAWVERKSKTIAATGEGLERCFGGKRITWFRRVFVVGSPWVSWSMVQCTVRFRVQRKRVPDTPPAVALGRIC